MHPVFKLHKMQILIFYKFPFSTLMSQGIDYTKDRNRLLQMNFKV